MKKSKLFRRHTIRNVCWKQLTHLHWKNLSIDVQSSLRYIKTHSSFSPQFKVIWTQYQRSSEYSQILLHAEEEFSLLHPLVFYQDATQEPRFLLSPCRFERSTQEKKASLNFRIHRHALLSVNPGYYDWDSKARTDYYLDNILMTTHGIQAWQNRAYDFREKFDGSSFKQLDLVREESWLCIPTRRGTQMGLQFTPETNVIWRTRALSQDSGFRSLGLEQPNKTLTKLVYRSHQMHISPWIQVPRTTHTENTTGTPPTRI